MGKYVVFRVFPPEAWSDTGIDFEEYMRFRLLSELSDQGLAAVGEPEINLSIDVLNEGWGAGRAAVDVEEKARETGSGAVGDHDRS